MTRAHRDRVLLLAVVLCFVVIALLVTDLHRYLAYDEAIYLSQVYPGPALPFTAPRARGLPVLLAPLGVFDAPLPVIRGYLLLVNAGLMYLGFNAWLPVLRGRAVAAAAVFAVAWLPLFYSTEAFPNLPVAFGSLAAAGYLARYLDGAALGSAPPADEPTGTVNEPAGTAKQTRTANLTALIGCALALALVALIRPAEAGFVAAGLAVAALTRPGRELAVRWTAPLIGLAIGWAPWLIEAQLRFGSPLARLRAASANVGGGFHPRNFRAHLGYTDGPISGVVRGGIPRLGELWWLLMIVAVAVLLGQVVLTTALGRDLDRVQRAGVVAALVGLASASQYLFLTKVLEARFLLPSYALLSVALVAAVPWPSMPSRAGRLLAGTVGIALFIAFAQWQVRIADRIQAEQYADRRLAARLVKVVQREGSAPCFVASDLAFPVVAFGAGCRGTTFHPTGTAITVIPDDDTRSGGTPTSPPPVYVLTRTNPTRTGVHPTPGSVHSLAADGAAGWWLFIASPAQVVLAR